MLFSRSTASMETSAPLVYGIVNNTSITCCLKSFTPCTFVW